ncbi:major facilitator superfamily domain-containing protein [Sphaerosporella brunnea]|uniref:Major facilitator superfamily domain-containing protein n=1 Tax=Sphaerosporella brunnea TaxID=1250544 RepID=A0A5J5EZF6_9PEZI|nr:major facilitator superfamily domain-containing protein [Sphaerosporella brunnea]
MAEPISEKERLDSPSTSKTEDVSASLPVFEQGKGYVREYAPAKDGIELHPKPTIDPLDPLNFSKAQKLTCLSIVMALYFLFTWITTVTVPSFQLLQNQYGISYAQVNWTVAIPALGLTVGPLIWSSLADIFGRRLIFIIGTVIALASTIGAALAPNFSGYMAARFFQGLGVSPASTVGLAIINDLFFEHERGQKVGLWVLALDIGLLVGPLVGGFITIIDQYWAQWLSAIMFAVLLLIEVFLLPETLYPRSLMLSRLPTAGSGEELEKPLIADYGNIPRTRRLPFFNFKKVPGVGAQKPYDSLIYFLKTWSYPNVAIAVFFYAFAWYWWILSVITYLPVAYKDYKPEIQGLLFMGLILGTLFSELLCSGTLSDIIMLKLAKRNNDVRIPEMRLWLVYPAVLITTIGLIVWGISVDKRWHWIVGQIALFLFGAGIQIGNTAISSYVVDCYPLHAMSIIVYYAVVLNASAFINPFFISPWCETVGFTWTFTVQGLIAFFVMVPVTIVLQKYGRRMSEWRGPPSWVSPEYST